MKRKIYRWKFLREVDGKIRSGSGDLTWKIGKWNKVEGDLSLCKKGLHCSKRVYQAFSFVQGEILAKVECSGKSDIQDDKEAYSEMRIVKCYRWQKVDSVALSIFAAGLCLANFEKVFPDDKRPKEAIEAAKRWLRDPTKENGSATEPAARSAARSAHYVWMRDEFIKLFK